MTSIPKWLADAEAAQARREEATYARKALDAVEHAHSVNRALADLGITPIVPASAPAGHAFVSPAFLVESDPEQELYSVHALWDDSAGKVRLGLGHYWNDDTGIYPGRLLTTVDDVVHARREGPATQSQRNHPSTWDLRKIADDAARYLPSDVTSHDTGEIVSLLSGLTAAVLCLADAVSGADNCP
ncbi:hypothetical protein [Streptomyces sp. NPDC059787]|uniref:hypothetical protein n=1 Tax=Streptomyces sp. NPDC059787 TaxID=3346947 RepID=UPI00365053CC